MAQGHEFLGLTGEAAQTAQVAAGGGIGAAALLYLRHPGSLLRAVFLFAISFFIAILFGQEFASTSIARQIGINPVAAGALLALTGLAVANGLLRAVERFDFSKFLPGKG